MTHFWVFCEYDLVFVLICRLIDCLTNSCEVKNKVGVSGGANGADWGREASAFETVSTNFLRFEDKL